ncbi:MAG: diaminopimelate epimerase [Actinomycetota bacterium]|jgi:diaminopimelate epimerase|nr:diaminopimelate epimerase [Actinomycetota bacterium]
MLLEFTKMHGLGNDFVVIEDLAEDIDFSPEAVQWFCDRNFGVGGDGLILVRPATAPDADFFMLYYNADGTTAEMCGNGIRCFAKYLVDHGHVSADSDQIAVETLGGINSITVTRDNEGRMLLATVDMGEPILNPEDIPADYSGDQVFECPLETELGTFTITALSMGNPHAVIWVDDVDSAPVDTVGPLIESDAHFPAKTNVEFAQNTADGRILLRVWERGVGETMACGTGACAALVAAALSCRVGRQATIELPGGELDIHWAPSGSVMMTGPANEVFTGTVNLPEDGE